MAGGKTGNEDLLDGPDSYGACRRDLCDPGSTGDDRAGFSNAGADADQGLGTDFLVGGSLCHMAPESFCVYRLCAKASCASSVAQQYLQNADLYVEAGNCYEGSFRAASVFLHYIFHFEFCISAVFRTCRYFYGICA